METALEDFAHHCRIERRLAPLTCSAYERDVTACVRFLSENGIDDLRLVRPPDLRRFLAAEAERRPALGSQARTVATEQMGQIRDQANQYYEQGRDMAQQYYEQGRQRAQEWEQGLEDYVRQQPVKAVLMAAGIGLVVGFIWRRS